MSSQESWYVLRDGGGGPLRLRRAVSSPALSEVGDFEVQDLWVRPVMVWNEELGLVPDADPVPVRWAGEVPPGDFRLDVRGADPLPLARFWEPIARMEGRISERSVGRATACLAEWDDAEIVRWAETAALLSIDLWRSLRRRDDYREEIIGFGLSAIGAALGRGPEVYESVVQDPATYSPRWIRQTNSSALVCFLADFALRRRPGRRKSEMFLYTSFTDQEWHIQALDTSARAMWRDAISSSGIDDADNDMEVVAAFDEFLEQHGESSDAVEVFMDQLTAALEQGDPPDGDDSLDERADPPSAAWWEGEPAHLVHAHVDFHGFLKSRMVIADLGDDPSQWDARARAAVESYGGVVRELLSISDDLPAIPLEA